MTNKLLARIAALVLSVVMLGTVGFADGTASTEPASFEPSLDVASDTLIFVDADNSNNDITKADDDQITMMAYIVDKTVATTADIPAYADEINTPMVALDQNEGTKGFGNVLVQAEKIAAVKTGDKKIAVVLGGDKRADVVKYLIAVEQTPEGGTTVTIMNGATAIPVDVVDGVATLPTDTTLDVTGAYGHTFSLYSWVALDDSGAEVKEYLVPSQISVNASELDGVTLYAKFKSDHTRGDVDNDGEITTGDYTAVRYALFGNTDRAFSVGDKMFGLATMLKGDVDGDNEITTGDYTAVRYALFGNTDRDEMVAEYWYIVNK